MPNQTVPGGNELLDAGDILKNHLHLTYGSRVADLGCGGIGFFVMQAAQLVGDNGVVYAVDILKPVLSNVETRAKILNLNNIKTIWSDLEKYGATKINNETLDYAFLINTLFQNNNHTEILREAIRMLKKSGKLLVIDWQEGRFPIGPPPEHKIPMNQLVSMAESMGLETEKQFNAGKFHYGVIFTKE